MADDPSDRIAFSRLGPPGAPTPLVIAVPHSGRHYPASLLAAARLPRSALETIEDRYADLLVADAVAGGAVAVVAHMARALIDLNRDEREIDPAILERPPGPGQLIASSKVTGGLGVVPSRIAAGGALWKRRLSPADLARRISEAHRPYHAALAEALATARAQHGIAILLDCHSMPPIAPAPGLRMPPRLVIGDRHGCSAQSRFVDAACAAGEAAGLSVSRNRPYAGGHTLDRHGNPRAGRHALQIEIDRTLYLDATQLVPGPGLANVRRIVASIAAALIEEAAGLALAAE